MRGFKIAFAKLGKQLHAARARVARLIEQRRDVLKRVEVRDLSERAVVKLATERKHLTDIIKMIAYQAESDLLALLRPHYARADQEGRNVLHELFATAGDIRVTEGELHITSSAGGFHAHLPLDFARFAILDYPQSSASMLRIVGRCRAISRQLSPSSGLANTEPLFVPK
jgi:hypothetical protein